MMKPREQHIDRLLAPDIDPGRGFVEKKNIRIPGKGPGDEHPLKLARGKVANLLLAKTRAKSHGAEHCADVRRRVSFQREEVLDTEWNVLDIGRTT